MTAEDVREMVADIAETRALDPLERERLEDFNLTLMLEMPYPTKPTQDNQVARAPRYWTPLAASFPDDPKPSTLLAEFGAAGPYVFVVLLCTATAQGYAGGDKGQARMGWAALANKAGVTGEAAQTIVRRIAVLGEIDLLADDDFGFTAHLRDWERWMPKDLGAAERKARGRAKDV